MWANLSYTPCIESCFMGEVSHPPMAFRPTAESYGKIYKGFCYTGNFGRIQWSIVRDGETVVRICSNSRNEGP